MQKSTRLTKLYIKIANIFFPSYALCNLKTLLAKYRLFS